jgi:hypothetical protein
MGLEIGGRPSKTCRERLLAELLEGVKNDRLSTEVEGLIIKLIVKIRILCWET